MEKLIEALKFIMGFMKKPETEWPTACEHDDFYVCRVDLERMSIEDVKKLDELGFLVGSDDNWSIFESMFGKDFEYEDMTEEQWLAIRGYLTDCVHSFKYGSC